MVKYIVLINSFWYTYVWALHGKGSENNCEKENRSECEAITAAKVATS